MAGVEPKVRLLTFTNLYPNAVQPAHGLFVERRLLRLVSGGGVEAEVVAPVPRVFGSSNRLRAVPSTERRSDLSIHHPRFYSIRGLGRFIAPFTMMLSSVAIIRRILNRNGFDLIDAHYFYPDGVAAAMIARLLGKPLVITARGTDVNVLPDYWFSRRLIRWAAGVASRIITVSEALRAKLIALGVDESKIVTLRNGVDLCDFAPRDRADARQRLGLPGGLILLSVGNLIEPKGHHLVIESLRNLERAFLVVVGDGEMRASLRALASRLGVSERVRFTGVLDQTQMVDYYSAADMLVLATLREGMPNVVLEAVSCGLPVVATDCAGVAELIDRPVLGLLMGERSAVGISSAVRELMGRCPARADTRAAAASFGWQPTIEKQAALYRSVVARAKTPSA
jgi:teichuronic acid biosynthesis glycosyltransferase TuaC